VLVEKYLYYISYNIYTLMHCDGFSYVIRDT